MKWVREKVKKISALILIKKSSGREKGAKTSIIKAPHIFKNHHRNYKKALLYQKVGLGR